jgi:hypothetical protein
MQIGPYGFDLTISTSEFTSELRKYVEVSKKEIAEVINAKAFFIALKALKYTPTAKAASIRSELMAKVSGRRFDKKTGQWKFSHATVPRLYLIINARRRKAGKPGLRGSDMEAAAKGMLRARQHAAGFEKSGWAWSLKDLANYVPSALKYAQSHDLRIGQTQLGGATPAQPGDFPTAFIANRAWPKHEPAKGRGERLQTLMGDALSKAIQEETDSMTEYVRQKMSASARKFSAK